MQQDINGIQILEYPRYHSGNHAYLKHFALNLTQNFDKKMDIIIKKFSLLKAWFPLPLSHSNQRRVLEQRNFADVKYFDFKCLIISPFQFG